MRHILVVDDDANTLASLSRAFRLAGFEATISVWYVAILMVRLGSLYDAQRRD